jgi:g-D-glutamyl-meso-diaminopimelate peptidase
MAIVNTQIPITSERANDMILQLVQAYPDLRSEVLTTSAFGRQIRTLTMGSGERQVLFTAAHHANEWITALVLLKFAEDLAQAAAANSRIYGIEARTILKAATIHLVPLVDPDGVDLVTGAIRPGTLAYETARSLSLNYPQIPFPEGWKANLLGVDLNLQYPALWLRAREIKFSQGFTRPGPRDYVGRAPLSQLESRALAELTEQIDPALVLAYHTQGKVIYWQFQDIFVPGAQALAQEFARLSGYALEEVPEESSYAGYKDWFIQSFRRPGFTVEVGSGINPLPLSQFDEIYRDNLGILTTAALGLPQS